jgi:hypothetical protein
MDEEGKPEQEKSDQPQQQPSSNKAGRPPPIVLTSTTNLIQLQRHIQNITTASFEFGNTRCGAKIVTK